MDNDDVRERAYSLPPVSTAVLPPSTSPVAPLPEGRQFFGEVAQLPLLGPALLPVG